MRNEEIQDLLNIIAALVMRTGTTSTTITLKEFEDLCDECEGRAFSIEKNRNGDLKITFEETDAAKTMHERDKQFPEAKTH